MPIGEVLTQSDLKSLAKNSEANMPRKVFVAPTVYHDKTGGSSRWVYYATLQEALNQWKYLNKMPGAKAVEPKHSFFFEKGGNQTMGINVDFFFYHPSFGLMPAPYSFAKEWMYQKNIFKYAAIRFYKSDGSGPFYATINNRDFGITADVVKNVSPQKAEELDKLFREIVLLKANFNSLSKYLTTLSKRQLNKTEQQVYNEGLLRLQEYKDAIRQVKGVDFVFGKQNVVGQIGILPVIAWLVVAGISALIVGGYTAYKIAEKWAEVEKVRSDNDSVEFLTEAKIRIAKDPDISEATKQRLLNEANSSITKIQEHTENVEKQASSPGIFDKITNLVLIGGGIFLLSKVIK